MRLSDKVRALWHIMRGYPVIANCHFTDTVYLDGKDMLVTNCFFDLTGKQ